MLHRPTITNEAREGEPQSDADGQLWRTFEPTGRACTVCPCGTSTGFVGHAEALAVVEQHWSYAQQERTTPEDLAVLQDRNG